MWTKRIERIEELLEEVIKLQKFLIQKLFRIAISAKGKVMPATIAVGGKGATFKFTEFDGPNGTGNDVPPSGPISYASDNMAVATVDSNGQVTAVGPGTANITGVDPASVNKVAAGDVITVIAAPPPPPQVAVSATGVLTAN